VVPVDFSLLAGGIDFEAHEFNFAWRGAFGEHESIETNPRNRSEPKIAEPTTKQIVADLRILRLNLRVPL